MQVTTGEMYVNAKIVEGVMDDLHAMQNRIDSERVSGLLAEAEISLNSAIMGILAAKKRIEKEHNTP